MPAPNLTLAELQVEAIRGVIEELLTSSPTDDTQRWAMHAVGEISRILDMQDEQEVINLIVEQDKRAT